HARALPLAGARRQRRVALADVLSDIVVRAGPDCGAAQPHLAARGALCPAWHCAVRLLDLRESTLDWPLLGRARRLNRRRRHVVGARGRRAARTVDARARGRMVRSGSPHRAERRMTLLRTYIVLAVLRGVATVMAVLIAVTCVIEFVGQLNDVGTGDYGLQAALIYIGLRVPRTVFTTL